MIGPNGWPALATGGRLVVGGGVGLGFGLGLGIGGGEVAGITLIIAASVSVRPAVSVTVNLNFSAVLVDTVGAVNVALAVLALFNTAGVPPVCVQAYVSRSPFGS